LRENRNVPIHTKNLAKFKVFPVEKSLPVLGTAKEPFQQDKIIVYSKVTKLGPSKDLSPYLKSLAGRLFLCPFWSFFLPLRFKLDGTNTK